MIQILFYFLGIYSHPLALLNFLKFGAVACNPIDRRPFLSRFMFYGSIAFVFDIWLLGRFVHFMFAISLFVATLGVAIFGTLTLILWVTYLFRRTR